MNFRRNAAVVLMFTLAFLDGFIAARAPTIEQVFLLGSTAIGALGTKLVGLLDLLALVGLVPARKEDEPYHSRP